MQRLAVAVLALGLAPLASAATSSWEIDPAHSQVNFKVRHMMISNVEGKLGALTGTIQFDDKAPAKSTVEAQIDVTGINTGNDKRDGHLKSPDFFDVAKFPSATFKSTKIQKSGKGKFKVTGDLTLHGVTKPVVLAVEGPSAAMKDPFGATRRAFSATGKINRKDFGLTWNKALEGGGFLVGDEVTLDISVEAIEKPAAPAAPAAK